MKKLARLARLWILKEPKKKLGLLIICAVLIGSIACFWRDTGDLILSVFLGVLAMILVYSLLMVGEASWAASWGDLEETGYHMEDPRHPSKVRGLAPLGRDREYGGPAQVGQHEGRVIINWGCTANFAWNDPDWPFSLN